MAKNDKMTHLMKKAAPFIAGLAGDVNADTVDKDLEALVLALNAHKTSADHDSTAHVWTALNKFLMTMVTASILPSLAETYDIGSDTRRFRKGFFSELSSLIFKKDNIIVLDGRLLISKMASVLPAAVLSTDLAIDFGETMIPGDVLIMRSEGKMEYIEVGALESGTTYTVTRDLDGSGANDWPEGEPFAVLGSEGDGWLEISAVDERRFSVYAMGTTFNAAMEIARYGEIVGWQSAGFSGVGLAFGDFANNKYFVSTDADGMVAVGLSLKIGTGEKDIDLTGVQIDDTEIVGQNNGVDQVVIGVDGKLTAGGGSAVLDADGITLNSTSNYLDTKAALVYKYASHIYYSISGELGYRVYHYMTAPVGFKYGLEHRNWVINNNPGALYDLLLQEGNATYKYGLANLNIDLNSTNNKSLKLSMKHYDYSTGKRAEGKLYYYSKLGEGYNTVTLSSECQDPTEGIKTAFILLRSASYYAEVSSKIDIEADEVNVAGTLGATNISETPTPNYIPKANTLGKIDAGWLPGWNYLTTPLTSTSWDGDNKTTSDRAIVDLSTVFGVPGGVKAVLMSIQTRADAANDYIRFGPNSTYNHALTCRTAVAGQIAHASGIVPCDANGDIYCHPSGTVEGVYVWIWGYWL